MLLHYELVSTESFHPRLHERYRFYQIISEDGSVPDGVSGSAPDPNEYGNFIQGVHDESVIFSLSPAQMGVLATFAPPMKGFVTNNAVLIRFRRAFHVILKRLAADGWSCTRSANRRTMPRSWVMNSMAMP